MFKKAYLRKLNEDIGIETNDADMAEPEVTDAPPEPTGEGDEFAPTADEDVSESQGGAAFNDLRSYMDTLPQDGQVSNQQIIDLGKKYADYFREVKDTSVGSAIRDRQLANVRERLRRTNDPIDRIAEQCGFFNANYLKTLFKRSFGMTMREWRKQDSQKPVECP